MSLYSGRFIHTSDMYKLTLAYRDLGIRNLFSFKGYDRSATSRTRAMRERTFKPRSSSVRSSTLAATTSHRQSTSAIYPRQSGLAAVNASWEAINHVCGLREGGAVP